MWPTVEKWTGEVSDQIDKLGTVIIQRSGAVCNTSGDGRAALIVSICDAPTYGLIAADGTRFHWRQDLTRPATEEETVEYWRRRAERAEERLSRLENPIDANSNSA